MAMAKKEQAHDDQDEGRPSLERDVHQSLKHMGWLIPVEETGAERAEVELDATPLPDALRDADAIFDGPPGLHTRLRAPGLLHRGGDEQNLARAAREGKAIPPEIEEIMRRDRKAAEEKLGHENHGEDVR